MKSLAFLLPSSVPTRVVLSARPWICGRPLQSQLPTRRSNFLRIVAQSEDAAPEPPVEQATEAAPEPPVEQAIEAVPEPVKNETTSEAVAAAAAPQDSSDDGSAAKGQRKRRRRTRQKREVTLKLEDMTVGMEFEGTVKSVMDYGAFIGDIGTPTDGLLHVSQLSQGYVEKVSDIVQTGQKLKVRVLAVDVEKGNFSLTTKTPEELAESRNERRSGGDRASRKEALNKKWDTFSFDEKVFLDAKITSITDFGAFAKLIGEDGGALESAPTEGLIHISELAEGRVESVSALVTKDQVVKVRVYAADRKRNRISLSMREYREAAPNGSSDKTDFSKDLEAVEANQDSFKTTMEIAFEKARAKASAS